MIDNYHSSNAALRSRKSKPQLGFLFSIVSLICFLPLTNRAQSHMQDVIELNDGSVYRGLIKIQQSDLVKIEIAGGSVIAIPRNNIDTIFQETGSISNDFIYRQKQFGYFNVTSIGAVIGSKPYNPYGGTNQMAYGFTAQTIHGYRLYSHFLTGAGVGVDIVDHPMLQLFADGRYEILKYQYTPYLIADLGYGFDLKPDDSLWSQKTTYTGGLMWGIGAGMRFNFKNVGAFVFDAEYKVMKRNEETSYEGGGSYLNEYSLQRIVFKIGLAF